VFLNCRIRYLCQETLNDWLDKWAYIGAKVLEVHSQLSLGLLAKE